MRADFKISEFSGQVDVAIETHLIIVQNSDFKSTPKLILPRNIKYFRI